jgi:hypothetical protein
MEPAVPLRCVCRIKIDLATTCLRQRSAHWASRSNQLSGPNTSTLRYNAVALQAAVYRDTVSPAQVIPYHGKGFAVLAKPPRARAPTAVVFLLVTGEASSHPAGPVWHTRQQGNPYRGSSYCLPTTKNPTA